MIPTISGSLGAGGANATLTYTGGSTSADGSGSYAFTVPYNWSGTVTPSLAGYTFSPTNRTYTNVVADQTAQNYTASAITYTISGNAGVAGATLSYTDGTSKTATSDSDGNYSFTVSYNWSGTVTPSLAGYTFSPTNLSYTNVLADQTDQNFTATQVFTISGNVGVAGATLSYTDGTPKTATSASDGSYSFIVSYNWSGTVTPSLAGYTFSPANISYTNVLADQTAQNYTASAITYTISGNAGGAGVKLTYVVNGVTKTVLSAKNGNYAFTVPLGWSGTIVPSMQCGSRNSLKRCYFTPSNRVYTNVQTNLTGQNFVLKKAY